MPFVSKPQNIARNGKAASQKLLSCPVLSSLLIQNGTGSGKGGTGWYLVVLGQYGAELVGTWW